MNAKAAPKRAFSSISNSHDDKDDESSTSTENKGPIIIDQTCNQIRSKIRTFIESGEMKVTHFQREIGVSSSSYGGFMKQNGPYKGQDNHTYIAAFKFFKKREEAGLKMPRKSDTNKKQKTKDGSTGSRGAKAKPGDEVAGIHLDGEESQSVPIYDTCDEIRRKINAHLRKEDVIQASFLRALSAQFPNPKSLTSKQLTDFRSKKGPTAGNNSGIFYAAYVYFEKLRIKEGKKKSKLRGEMEEAWGDEGITLRPDNRGFLCSANERPAQDKNGKISF